MRLHVIEPGHAAFEIDACLVVPIFEEPEPSLGSVAAEKDRKALAQRIARGTIRGKAEETYYLATPDSPYGGILLLGLGTPGEFHAETFRRAAGAAAKVFSAQRHTHIVLDASSQDALPVEAFVEGLMLAQYDFQVYKKPKPDPAVIVHEITVLASEGLEELRAGCGATVLMCMNTNWARDLANTPPNDLTPRILAAHAQELAAHLGCTCTVFDETKLQELGMNGILGVGKGSAEPPRLILLEYAPADYSKTVALIGKGITFDTGGISLKPAPDMHEMKYDMCGAAAVLGAFKTICQAKPHTRVICAVPTAENRPGPTSCVPGDIWRAYNGKTIEVLNTDAEGRLILCDTIAYIEKIYKPDAIIDIATLTGAIVVAFGHYIAGVFSNDARLTSELELASRATGERLWPMPMDDDYTRMLKSPHADLANIGTRGVAGAVVAACFLKEFVEKTPWAHIDIAGTAWGQKHISYLNPDHATGYGVRLLSQWVLEESRPNR